MPVRSSAERATRIRAAALVGVFLAVAGIILLMYPVSVSSYGLTAACGTTITRENKEPEALVDRFDTTLADSLDIPTPLDLDVGPYTKCTDALTFRRWVAWPAVVVGIAVAVLALRKLTWTNLLAARRNSTAGVPATAHLAKTSPTPPTPTPATVPAPIRTGAAGDASLPSAPPGWYPDPHQQNGLRWFDGSQWTAGTAPGAPTQETPDENESDAR
ncbi:MULTISPECIES: DUF2510 domain-containing protein [unclassified Rhodococcus (in: high G+C Gram-positive bacteria)]|uniref:DUF2510 domain-containing protein n=1 Tax=unclassified Rhodococcus (in: high G+C Gram-positive bacteria) TaxID=192944 RepID=UPI001C52BCA8|nr:MULTISPECIES: DUF2510 domain-containing protein [unclassified Rhodococcus (in: high G+C Gram-positive bacteria)]